MFFLMAYLPRWSPVSAPWARVRGFCWGTPSIGWRWLIPGLRASFLPVGNLYPDGQTLGGYMDPCPLPGFPGPMYLLWTAAGGERLELQHLLDRASMEYVGISSADGLSLVGEIATFARNARFFLSHFQQSRAGTSMELRITKIEGCVSSVANSPYSYMDSIGMSAEVFANCTAWPEKHAEVLQPSVIASSSSPWLLLVFNLSLYSCYWL